MSIPVSSGDAGGTSGPVAGIGSTATSGPATTSNLFGGLASISHTAILWVLGSIALIALAGPAPVLATMITVLLIVGRLLTSWPVYAAYLHI